MKKLTEKALLVNYSAGVWSARKFDRKATEEVNQNHGSTDAGRFNKILIKAEHLKPLQTAASAARNYHYEMTLPWGDNGERLLPSNLYLEYRAELGRRSSEFAGLVREFCGKYDEMIKEAERNLNGLFNRNEYPTAAEVADRFYMGAKYMPVPDTEDIRVNVGAAELESIRKEVKAEISDRFADAQRDIFQRAADQLRYMYARLSEEKGVFRDTLFNNVLELVDLLPKLNIAEDPKVNELAADLRSLYTDPENVRKDKQLREAKAKEAAEILNKFGAFFGKQ